MPVGFPCIDLIAIGAGGGSIAWVDDAGAPHVGPHSAGARPGPACYGRGGTEATTTDANVTLGRLRPASLLGGGMTLDPDLARAAVERFAGRIGLQPIAAADGIVRIANEHMAHGIRRMTIKRGLDPREFALIAFGGAGPMHAAEIARELQIPEVLIPPHPGATSALGLVSADARHDVLRSHIAPTTDADTDTMERLFTEMEDEARALLRAEGFADEDMRIERLVDLRYVGQVRALTLPAGDGPATAQTLAALTDRFHDAYEQEFKYAVRNLPVETRSVRISAIGPTAEAEFAGAEAAGDEDATPAVVGTQDVVFAETGTVPTPFYDRALLRPGMRFAGPAIVEQYDATTIVPPRTEVEVDRQLNLVLRIEA
jgi:N-methylhydantoinase A